MQLDTIGALQCGDNQSHDGLSLEAWYWSENIGRAGHDGDRGIKEPSAATTSLPFRGDLSWTCTNCGCPKAGFAWPDVQAHPVS